ncbi:MAG TPA: TIGR02391 family protein [Opitutaceae bacterium]|nr:TIGR02391 family protein [Opitutaceae bacterium]
MSRLVDILPTARSLLALSPEDLGMVLIQIFQTRKEPRFVFSDFVMPFYSGNAPPYPHNTREAISRAVAEAWQWLLNEGLIIHDPEQSYDYYCMTRKARNLKTRLDIEAYQQGHILPLALLHPRLAEKVLPMFTRGDYEVAVFQAFKEVEITVRRAAELSDDLLG